MHPSNRNIFGALIMLLIGFSSCEQPDADQRPNILLIMADDMGYSDMGVMGGEIKTPHLDALAKNGIVYTQFYNGARCCPTRAALMTGLYPHQAGMGWMTAADLGVPGYRGELSSNSVTIAEVLKENGYNTYLSGKWHLTDDTNARQKGNKESWPLQRGFDYFFGTLLGSGSYFTPKSLTSQNKIIDAPENFYYTDAISDTAVSMIRKNQLDNSPFFMYVSYTAPHWPLHAYEADFQPYLDTYTIGWDSLRLQRYRRQIKMGIIDKDWGLPERNPEAPEWSSLSSERKRDMVLRMAIYAAQVEVMDRGIGRIVSALKQSGELENTLIFFLQDNGACAEFIGEEDEIVAASALGTDNSFESYRLPWANASNTPFRLFKHWTHEGGIATPLIVHWPDGVTNPGRLSDRPGHLIDIMTTGLEVAEAQYPSQYKGNKITEPEGESLLASIKNVSDNRKSVLFWEHEANRAIRVGDWKLVLKASESDPLNDEWELYNLADDRTELKNLVSSYPEKAEEMGKMWDDWARRVEVFPLDNRPWGQRLRDPKAITKNYIEMTD